MGSEPSKEWNNAAREHLASLVGKMVRVEHDYRVYEGRLEELQQGRIRLQHPRSDQTRWFPVSVTIEQMMTDPVEQGLHENWALPYSWGRPLNNQPHNHSHYYNRWMSLKNVLNVRTDGIVSVHVAERRTLIVLWFRMIGGQKMYRSLWLYVDALKDNRSDWSDMIGSDARQLWSADGHLEVVAMHNIATGHTALMQTHVTADGPHFPPGYEPLTYED